MCIFPNIAVVLRRPLWTQLCQTNKQFRPLLVFWQNSLTEKHESQLGLKLQIQALKLWGMEYIKIKRLYSAVFPHASNSPVRPLSAGNISRLQDRYAPGRMGNGSQCMLRTQPRSGMQPGNTLKVPRFKYIHGLINGSPLSPLMENSSTQHILATRSAMEYVVLSCIVIFK